MKVALVVARGIDRSGRERIVPPLVALMERLAQRHEVHVFSLGHEAAPSRFPLMGATIQELGGRDIPPGLGLLRLAPRLLAALRAAGPFDVLHAYMGVPSGVLAALAGRALGVASVATLDGGELVNLSDIGYGLDRNWRRRLPVSLCLRLADRVTVASGSMRILAERRGRAVEQVLIGVDTTLFRPRTAEPPAPPWRLLQVGSLSPVKDQATLLRSFAVVVAGVGVGDVHLDVVGVDTLAGSVHGLCRDLGLEAHVTFHGQLRNDELPPLYERAHAFVLSSRHEAGGFSVLEAAATGVPSVGTAVGHIADLAPERAVAVPVGEPAALAEAILALLRQGERRARIASAAQAWARAHDADWTARRFEEVYAKARGGKDLPSPSRSSSDHSSVDHVSQPPSSRG